MPIIHYPHHKIWMRPSSNLVLTDRWQIKSIYHEDRVERCCGGMAASITYIMCYFMIVWWWYLGSPHKWLNSYQESTYVFTAVSCTSDIWYNDHTAARLLWNVLRQNIQKHLSEWNLCFGNWCRSEDKSILQPMVASILLYVCVRCPQCVLPCLQSYILSYHTDRPSFM